MKLEALLQGVRVLEMNASAQMEITDVTDSSREASEGTMFIAVRGTETDGHRYIPNAVEQRAAVIVCEDVPGEDVPWVRVENTRAALPTIAANFYGRPKLCMIGVTGTNGKTSTTYLLKSMLENALRTKVGLIGTICNMVGDEPIESSNTTPGALALQKLLVQMERAGCTHVVMEVSSHALVQERVAGVMFDVGAFTNLTKDHLDYHKTMENYATAKALLFRKCKKSVFNIDDRYSASMMKDACGECFTFGTGEDADLRAENIVLASDHVQMDVCTDEFRLPVRIGIPGRFTVSNGLTALAIALQLGIAPQTAIEALSKANGVKGRIEVVPTPNYEYTVLIDYAHTPDGLENILKSVRDFSKGRIITVFGCGGDRDRTKRPMMGEIAERLSDIVIVTSDNPRTEEPMSIIEDILKGMNKTPIVEENRRKAIRLALRLGQKNDMILLAGKGHETYQIIGTEKTHLDEREEVASALCEMLE